jgi:hypothetical protein
MSHGVITPKCTQEEDIWSDTTCWQSAGHLPLGTTGCVANALPGTLMQTDLMLIAVVSCSVTCDRPSPENVLSSYCGVILLHDDARLYMAQETWNFPHISFGICLTPYSPALAPTDFNLLHALKEHISPLMNTSHMLLSCGWWNSNTSSTYLGWTNLSYTMKSASPFRGQWWNMAIQGHNVYCLFPLLKLCLWLMGTVNLFSYPPSFICRSFTHKCDTLSHAHHMKSEAHLSLHDIICMVLTQQHENRLYTLSLISYFSH